MQCGVSAALLVICGWVTVPFGDIGFTMQSFGVFLILCLFGGGKATAAFGIYLLLGAVGLPVFSGFQGGFGVLLGPTGGYLWGFPAACLVFWLFEKKLPQWLLLILGMLTCYVCGCGWFYFLYTGNGLGFIVLKCVVPYILPDGGKLFLALLVSKRIHKTGTAA